MSEGQARTPSMSRRRWLGQAVAGVCATSMMSAPSIVSAAQYEPDRKLRIVNAHTWEKLDIVYYTHGFYIDESLAEINYVMRDRREGKSFHMDPHLLDDLVRVHAALGTDQRIHLLSGYRTPATNEKLRQYSSGVAKFSLHMEGRAADIYIPGVPVRELQKAALLLQAGGVGFYGTRGFVHIDTGPVRHWERA